MCGRYFFTLKDDPAFARLKAKMDQLAMFEYASDEIFPSHKVLVLLPEQKDYTLDIMQWGIEGYAKRGLINARSETLMEKKTFHTMRNKRCLIPCNGFFEWVKTGKRKQKIYIQRKDTPLFYLAGIYNEKKQFVIVTGESQHEMKAIHDRTPIILSENEILPYLNGELPFIVDNTQLTYTNCDVPRRASSQLCLFDDEEEGKKEA